MRLMSRMVKVILAILIWFTVVFILFFILDNDAVVRIGKQLDSQTEKHVAAQIHAAPLSYLSPKDFKLEGLGGESFFHVPKWNPPASDSADAYYAFAESRYVKLDDIPEDLLLFLSEHPHGDLIFAIIFVESSFKRKNKTANNYGLMQIADVHFRKTARARPYIEQCGVKSRLDLYDPHKNICVGSNFFLKLLEENNMDKRKALMQYNASYRKRAYASKVIKVHKEVQAIRSRKTND